MIKGISHITFIVRDLNRSAQFFQKIFDAKEVYSRGDTVKYLLINNLWIALNQGEPLPQRSYNHIAFQVDKDDIESYITKIKQAGAQIKPDRPNRKSDEGQSIYFYDFDNHLFELHTGTLPQRLAAYKKEETT